MAGSRSCTTLAMLLGLAAPIAAQQVERPFALQNGLLTMPPVGVIESMPLEPVTSVPNAAFSAEAETEFTQVLGDGNRIERRYSSMMARDSQGRTRREEEIALVGPLAVDGASPRLVTILDPVAGLSYTLDDRQRVAYRNPMSLKLREAHAYAYAYEAGQKGTRVWVDGRGSFNAEGKANVAITAVPGQRLIVGEGAAAKITTESLGARSIEGVMAEGTRTTSTIAAGTIGNVLPIDIVTERWYSRELQMPVLISRKDPRTGDSIYRLRNIVRSEPAPDLFTVPSDYQLRDGQLGGVRMLKKIEEDKIERRQKE
jgi:hypothetical protein